MNGAGLSETQRIFLKKVEEEYTNGFIILNSLEVKNTLTIYGSSRLKPDHPKYKEIMEIAQHFRQKGWGVATGGGPGVMKAAFEKDHNSKVDSIAFRISDIEGEKEQASADISATFDIFSVRKYFLKQTSAFLVAPGGFGTLDEFADVINLIKTGKLMKKPIYLYDSNFWNGLVKWMKKTMAEEYGTIDAENLEIFKVVDSLEEISKDLLEK